ncbi:MAG: hypothetical protein P8X91_01570 [Candidatus Bathyarchaeota archaeon]
MRMITRTFRMNPEYDKVLSEEAEKHGLSVSSLLNQIIQQYVMFTRFTEKNPVINLPYNIFDQIIENINNNDLEEIGDKTGSSIPEETILQRGKQRNFETIFWLMEGIYDKYNNWFKFSRSTINGEERIHFAHQMNKQWSTFLENYIASMFKSILEINPKIEKRDNSITVYLPKKSPFKNV